jgi:hypothetical protein
MLTLLSGKMVRVCDRLRGGRQLEPSLGAAADHREREEHHQTSGED